MTFLGSFLTKAPTEIFTANLELLFAQDEFSKTLNECAKFALENPPEWIQDICRRDQSMTMKAQRASRRSSLPINSALGAGGTSDGGNASELTAELEKLRLQNKKARETEYIFLCHPIETS